MIPCVTRMLALETSARVGSVALFDQGRLVAEETFSHGLQNAAMLLPLIDTLCRKQQWTPQGIQVVAVSIGPGSFTGLRIGVTLAKTLCYATGAKLVVVPSLKAIAANAPADTSLIMPVLDARRGQVFAAVYERRGGELAERSPAQLCPLAKLLADAPRPIALLGEGVAAHREAIPADPSIRVLPEETWTPTAAAVGRLAIPLVAAGEFADPFALTPVYMRKPEAQERMEAGLLKHLENP